MPAESVLRFPFKRSANATSDESIPAIPFDTQAVAALKAGRAPFAPYVAGKFPLDWVRACRHAHPEALALALGIRALSDMRGAPVSVGNALGKRLGLESGARKRALAALERAGLVRVERKPGCVPRAMLLPWPQASGPHEQ